MMNTFIKGEDTMMKKAYSGILSLVILLFAACQSAPLENEPVNPEPERVTIPYSLTISSGDTKVSYDGTGFSFAEGDMILISGQDRTDITGVLTLDSNTLEASGSISYMLRYGPIFEDTGLVATLVHKANQDVSSYAEGVLGYTGETLPDAVLKEAAEKYSLFTANFLFGGEGAVQLEQQACFLDVSVTFSFSGGAPQMEEAVTQVDLETLLGTNSGSTKLVRNGDDFSAKFLAVLPAGQDVKDFTINICDRQITFENSKTLVANKKYKVARTITFEPQLGDPFWSDGTYGRLQHKEGVDIVGIIVYVNRNSSDKTEKELDDAVTETENGGGHALVMALKNANKIAGEGESWISGTTTPEKTYTKKIDLPKNTRSVATISGFNNTKIQSEYSECNATLLAKNYQNGTDYDGTTTGWFLPSVGQWCYAICSFGEADDVEQWFDGNGNNWLEKGNWSSLIHVKQGTIPENLLVKKLNERLELLAKDYDIEYDSFGMENSDGEFADNYWTSSEHAANDAIRLCLGSVESKNDFYYSTIKMKTESKTAKSAWRSYFIMKVRPFLAF